MDTPTTSSHDLPAGDTISIDFDYDQCMQQPFYKELYDLFTRAKQTSKWTSLYPCTFSAYLHAAHEFCAYLTKYEENETENSYEAKYQAAYLYLCSAVSHEGVPKGFNQLDCWLFHPIEMFLIQHLAFAIVCTENTPAAPYQLIELFQNHLTDKRYISEDWQLFSENRNPVTNGSPHPHEETMSTDWATTKKLFYEPILGIIKRYQAGGSPQQPLTATEETASTESQTASGAGPIRLNLNRGKHVNNLTNTMHIFNIMHEMGFFADAHGSEITKEVLFDALATFFDCSGLHNWSVNLANSRKKAEQNDNTSQLKIFKEMGKVVKAMEDKQLDYLEELQKAKDDR